MSQITTMRHFHPLSRKAVELDCVKRAIPIKALSRKAVELDCVKRAIPITAISRKAQGVINEARNINYDI